MLQMLLTTLVILLTGAQNVAAKGGIRAGVDSATDSLAAADDHGHVALEADPELTLHEVILHTVKIEPGRLVVAARRVEADALSQNARSLLSSAPTISANHGTDGPWSGEGYRRWDVGLRFPLWWPGQRNGRQRTARAAGAAANQAQRAHAVEVAGWVRQAVARIAVTQVRLALTEAEWRAEVELATQVERAVALEELANRELLLAGSASLDRRLLYLGALEEARHAEGNYFLLTGLARWPSAWSETPADSDAFEDHPLLLLATEEVTRARAELDRITADQWGRPTLALGSEHERNDSNSNFNNRIIAGVSIPLGRRSDARAKVASARRVLAQKRRAQKRLERELRGQLAKAEHRFGLSKERVATAAEQGEMAAEYLRLTELGFGLGETDLGQLLRARSRATAAEQTHQEALILRQSSAGEMNQALGVVP